MKSLSYQEIDKESISILGIPFDANSSFRKGPALAPSRIRENRGLTWDL